LSRDHVSRQIFWQPGPFMSPSRLVPGTKWREMTPRGVRDGCGEPARALQIGLFTGWFSILIMVPGPKSMKTT